MSQSAPRTVVLALVGWVMGAGTLSAQNAVTTAKDDFRVGPEGGLLGVIEAGVTVPVARQEDRWVEAELEGWMWMRSIQVTSQGDFDLVVSEAAGENVRVEPAGKILARLESGTLLQELERRPGWIRVRRRGWIRAASVSVGGSGTTGAVAGTAMGGAPAPDSAASVLGMGAGRGVVLSAPGGDTLATTSPYSDLQVLGREGGWVRVRVEGWMWSPLAGDSTDPAESAGPSPSLSDVIAEPERFRGRLVRWRLQFISLERAEPIRTDFFEGEPFLLTRPLEGQRLFVYVAVPAGKVAELEGLLPLEQIEVVGRLRTGASSLTGSPIVDLLELGPREGARTGNR